MRACVRGSAKRERERIKAPSEKHLSGTTNEGKKHTQARGDVCTKRRKKPLLFSLAERKKKRNKWGLSEKGTDTTTERKKEGALSHAVVVLEAFFRFAVSLTH